MPPLKDLEAFVDQSLPQLPEPHHEPVLAPDSMIITDKEKAMKRKLARLRLQNEAPDKLIPA